MVLKDCTVEGCGRPHEARGLCRKHYKRTRREIETTPSQRREYLKRHGRSLKGRYIALRRAAKNKGLGFDITEEQHADLLKKPCHYCKEPLHETGHALDRVLNDVGYVFSNVVTCCIACNRIKGFNLTYDEMIAAMNAVMALRRSA